MPEIRIDNNDYVDIECDCGDNEYRILVLHPDAEEDWDILVMCLNCCHKTYLTIHSEEKT